MGGCCGISAGGSGCCGAGIDPPRRLAKSSCGGIGGGGCGVGCAGTSSCGAYTGAGDGPPKSNANKSSPSVDTGAGMLLGAGAGGASPPPKSSRLSAGLDTGADVLLGSGAGGASPPPKSRRSPPAAWFGAGGATGGATGAPPPPSRSNRSIMSPPLGGAGGGAACVLGSSWAGLRSGGRKGPSLAPCNPPAATAGFAPAEAPAPMPPNSAAAIFSFSDICAGCALAAGLSLLPSELKPLLFACDG
mmetsp:Transcript_55129/g.129065  ORF Transcript_55129/g.129065 Transcript_55129/m.129065 type:complete len:246 (-) Transcript_55129:2334-3071(-)